MFIPGYPPSSFPLARHLPPLGEGVCAAYAEQFSGTGDLVVDPFGQSPRAAIELARIGRRAIIASSNPVVRFALIAALDPPAPKLLRAALTRLADARLAGGRVEMRLRDLYRSICPDCGTSVEVDFYLWDKDTLAEKSYFCQACGKDKSCPADPADVELAAKHSPRGPHYFWALDRVAPLHDPDREFAADVLDAYTPRALHAIFTLTYKAQLLDLPADERRALDLLLLMAYDEGTSLEGARPRTLRPHTRYREKNLWLTLERLASDEGYFANADNGARSAAPLALPDLLNRRAAAACVFDGSIRDLTKNVDAGSVSCMISALPHRNPVLWTLSAVWAAWLWGEGAAGPIKNFIRRRRYDWSWHEGALRSGFAACHKLLRDSGHFVALLPEADAGFVGAALTAADGAGFDLSEFAVRADPPEAQFVWSLSLAPLTSLGTSPSASLGTSPSASLGTSPSASLGTSPSAVIPRRVQGAEGSLGSDAETPRGLAARSDISGNLAQALPAGQEEIRTAIQKRAEEAAATVIRERGEPIRWNTLSGAAFVALARDHLLRAAVAEKTDDPLDFITDAIEAGCANSPQLVRLDEGESAEPRSGWWWLTDPVDAAEPLADRVERETARLLAEARDTHATVLEYQICAAFRGLITPDANLFRRCLESYGEERHAVWRFRPEDDLDARAQDVERITGDLSALGRRLGYGAAQRGEETEWRDPEAGGATAFHFFVTDSASIASFVCAAHAGAGHRVVVIPGGRAGLIQYKLHRNPHLRSAIEKRGWLFLKFRHVRRLLAETSLNRNDILTALGLDPIREQGSEQLPLW